ncbi:MAG: TraB/GumN family protein [Pseudomonadota bacterium]
MALTATLLASLCLTLACSSTGVTPPAAVPQDSGTDSDPAPPFAAVAVDTTTGQRFAVSGESNRLTAADRALAQCRATVTKSCELIRQGKQKLRTAAELRAGLAKSSVPLYLWRLRGTNATVYLGGTIHLLKPALYPLAPPFERAFDAADTLVVEVDISDLDPTVVQQQTLRRALLPPPTQLSSLLNAEQRARLAARAAEYGIPAANLEPLTPMFASQLLSVSALKALGYPEDGGVERYFLDRAGDRRVLQLETLEQQLDLLFSLPLDVQRDMLVDSLSQFDSLATWLESMVLAWLSGDVEQLATLFDEQTGDSKAAQAFSRALLDERNAAMSEKIAGYLGSEGTYLVLVGAAHFGGDQGLLARLKRLGFSAEQVSR